MAEERGDMVQDRTPPTAALVIIALAACGCSTTVDHRGPAQQVSLGEFSAPRVESPQPNEAAPPTSADSPPVRATESEPTRLGAGDAAGAAGETDAPAGPVRELEPGEQFVVDALVGQINGQPVFADEFLEPIEDQLIAEARQKTQRQFAIAAFGIIRDLLLLKVRDALFLAEAESALTPEQQVGLRQFLGLEKERIVAQRGGIEEQVRRELAERGETLEGQLERSKKILLIRDLFQRRIASRVVVSWRDIEREYNRKKWQERFNPPARVRLARIQLPTEAEAERISEAQRRLAAGEPFLAVAESLEDRRCGLWDQHLIRDQDFSSIEYAVDELTEKVAELREKGDTVGPFEVGAFTWWLHVASYEKPPKQELYDPDVQRILHAAIRAARIEEEEDRYVERIMDEGIVEKINDMAEQLLTIAVRRYGPR
jgi:hypothetical protein